MIPPSHGVYLDAEPPDLGAPVSPSAERTAAIEKDLWKVEGVTRASLVICVRNMLTVGIKFEGLKV